MTKIYEIMNSAKPDAAMIGAEPWGPEFLREMDLVIAAGVLESKTSGNTLYEDMLTARIADLCSPLDGGCTPNFMGTVQVPAVYDARSPEMQSIARELAAQPRGAWAIWSNGSGFDIWASTGYDSISTPSGQKYLAKSARSPGLEFRSAYGAVIGMIAYRRRIEIENLMIEASAKAANVVPGSTFKDIHCGAKIWSNARFVKVVEGYYSGGGNAYEFELSKRGARRVATVGASSFCSMLKLPIVMPAQFEDPGNAARLLSLHERRIVAAQAAWPAVAETLGFDAKRGSMAAFVWDGDIAERDVFDGEHPSGRLVIVFNEGSDSVASASYEPGQLVSRIAA